MSIILGEKILSGLSINTKSNAHSLFDFKWSDHILNEMSWLRSDTYSWHNGDLYKAAYNHLVADVNGKSADNSDTIGSYTIWYVLADDGHKIIGPDQEPVAQNIYNATGIAWYYILDKTNKRFKLPRNKHGFTGLRSSVGTYVSAGLPNITGTFNPDGYYSNENISGAFSNPGTRARRAVGTGTDSTSYQINFDASRSSSIYGNSDTVQPPAVETYLYFYVGEYSQSQAEQVATLDVELFNNKADTNMLNLSDAGKNIANWSNNVTNCITEIPQDIHLELDNGTLTVKAGSKIYIPNGFESDGVTPKFDVIITDTDINPTGWANLTGVVVIKNNGSEYNFTGLSQCTSGTTEAAHSDGNLWYDTTNNIMKRWDGASVTTWTTGYSLPIAIVTSNGTAQTSIAGIKSIDQVFNGFGYIGSTVFALPGVKGLIPDGRNDDGTLKNIETISNSVYIRTPSWTPSNDVIFTLTVDSIGAYASSDIEYIESENRLFFKNDSTYVNHCFAVIASYDSNKKITSFTPKKVFHTLDYNDKSTISGWGMPSSKYIDLTLGSSGTQYTAPANGYFESEVVGNSNGINWTEMDISLNGTVIYRDGRYTSYTNNMRMIVPVRKGALMSLRYNNSTVATLRFIYAEGEI